MATESNEPRALTAALAGPAFATRGASAALHAANRHVERWAPEAGADRVPTMRTLGFVDRMVAPWIETAQRSASMRLFSQYATRGTNEREGSAVSWVFPRPWYQDELDWMASARQVTQATGAGVTAMPSALTTRGTFVPTTSQSGARPAPTASSSTIMPAALYEYVAPSLSLARSAPADMGGPANERASQPARSEAYSPLFTLAAIEAASVMSRAIGPAAIASTRAPIGRAPATPALRGVLSALLERASQPNPATIAPTRLSTMAPEMVTPPATRADLAIAPDAAATTPAATTTAAAVDPRVAGAAQLAAHYAEQRAQLVDVQRVVRASAERELVARTAQAAPASTPAVSPTVSPAATGTPPNAQAAAVEGELRRRLETTVAEQSAQRARDVAQASTDAAAAEQRRIEERVAQRVAERTGVQRLHEQARTAAAVDARAAESTAPRAESASATADVPGRAPAAMIAALAALPPELAAIIGRSPDRAMAALGELTDSLRAAELFAHHAATGAPAAEPTRGPRVVLPAGIGGLVAAVDRVDDHAGRRAALLASATAPVSATPAAAASARFGGRVPQIAWLAGAQRISGGDAPRASSNALGATTNAAPAALHHVAWADRWLARFAGASPQSLDVLSAAEPTREGLRALANAAPSAVFVSPAFDELVAQPTASNAAPGTFAAAAYAAGARAPMFAPTPIAAAAATTPGPRLIESRAPITRYDDSAETPDDVFLAIAAAASRGRGASPSTPAATTAPVGNVDGADRASMADHLAQLAPSAPGAGMSAQLSASPFAVALRHVLPMSSSASTFDVRALFGGGLSATYLAGLLAPDAHAVTLASTGAGMIGSRWLADSSPAASSIAAVDTDVPRAADWQATYVAPEAAVSPDAAVSPEASSVDSQDSRVAAPSIASPVLPGSVEAVRAAAPVLAAQQMSAQAIAPTTTLRSALLSWDVTESTPGAAASFTPPADTLAGAPASFAARRAMIDAMSLPLLGDMSTSDSEHGGTWMSPGMVADRAHGWAVAQERSSSDLALDFVGPELVLAARVYGLGPAEAAQAARLAIAGPGQLTAMAGTVDRTFVQALAIDAERREAATEARQSRESRGETGASSAAASSSPAFSSPAASSPASVDAQRIALAPITSFPISPRASAAESSASEPSRAATALDRGGSASASFGVARRSPRGAFLWPSATVAALGLNAAAPDGQLSMSVAALELLAAQAVAEIGTYAALGDPARAAATAEDGASAGSVARSSVPGATASFAGGAPDFAMVDGVAQPRGAAIGSPSSTAARVAGSFAGSGGVAAEPSEADVLTSAAVLVPSSRRARFDALYLALSQSSVGREWSPAARAARALALAGRSDDTGASARERAATAWDVLPVVFAGPEVGGDAAAATALGALSGQTGATGASIGSQHRGTRASAAPGRELVGADAGAFPGLSNLSARAGEALGSYVTPMAAPAPTTARGGSSSSASASSSSTSSASARSPIAVPELVRTGRPAGRFGGGEVEIPAWFETAARKMLESRGSTSDGLSLAEMTLVTAAPASHVAASTRSVPSALPAAPAVNSRSGSDEHSHIDVEKLANDVYRAITALMDAAKSRNGEPYQ